MKTKQLYLLIPTELPTENILSKTNKQKVFLSINLALKSLNSKSQEEALFLVNQALVILSTNEVLSTDLQSKDTKQLQKTLDYDIYFNVNHVKSKEPDICLVRSVLVTYQCFLLLVYKRNKFNSENIKIQRQGFRSYFQLLSRVFNLSIT